MDLPPGTNNPPNALGVTDANREWSTNSIQIKNSKKYDFEHENQQIS